MQIKQRKMLTTGVRGFLAVVAAIIGLCVFSFKKEDPLYKQNKQ